MYTRGRTLRFTAVVTLVVVSLTGFSTGHHSTRHHSTRHHGGTHSGGGSGGGGCSSSHQDHDGYKSSGTSRKHRSTRANSGSSAGPSTAGSGAGAALRDATAVLVSCATAHKPYSTVEVTNPNSRTGTFTVRVAFLDADGGRLGSAGQDVSVSPRARATVRVRAADTVLVGRADHCDVEPSAAVKH